MTITLTLGDIRAAGPCADGWTKLLRAVGQDHAAPDMGLRLGLGDVLINNGLDDARWCFRCLPARDAVRIVMPAVKRASAYTKDQRVHDCIAALERWLDGDDAVDLRAAMSAARAAMSAARAAAEAAVASWAARAAWSAVAAAEAALAALAAEAAWAASWAASWAARAAWAAVAAAADAEAAEIAAGNDGRAAEIEAQRADIMRLSPPLILKGGAA